MGQARLSEGGERVRDRGNRDESMICQMWSSSGRHMTETHMGCSALLSRHMRSPDDGQCGASKCKTTGNASDHYVYTR